MLSRGSRHRQASLVKIGLISIKILSSRQDFLEIALLTLIIRPRARRRPRPRLPQLALWLARRMSALRAHFSRGREKCGLGSASGSTELAEVLALPFGEVGCSHDKRPTEDASFR